MALRYIDSMGDHYDAAHANEKWTAGSAIRQAGLHGYGLTGSYLRKGLVFGSNTIIQEMQINRQANADNIFILHDTYQAEQIWISYGIDGTITVSRWGSDPAADIIAQTAPDLIRVGVWYHIGWKVFLHPSAGSVEVRLNGGPVVNVSGVKTVATSLPWSGAVGSVGVGGPGFGTIMDDVVVMDDVDDGIDDPRLPGGGGFDKFIGPVIVRVKRPDTAGLSAEWTPNPTGPNYVNVDDVDPDDDQTSNIAPASAIGASDLFGMEDLAAGEDILAAQSLVLAKKTNDGTAAVARLVRDNGAITQGPTIYQPTTYAYMHLPEPTLPDGSTWTAARWNAIQYGYKRVV